MGSRAPVTDEFIAIAESAILLWVRNATGMEDQVWVRLIVERAMSAASHDAFQPAGAEMGTMGNTAVLSMATAANQLTTTYRSPTCGRMSAGRVVHVAPVVAKDATLPELRIRADWAVGLVPDRVALDE